MEVSIFANVGSETGANSTQLDEMHGNWSEITGLSEIESWYA